MTSKTLVIHRCIAEKDNIDFSSNQMFRISCVIKSVAPFQFEEYVWQNDVFDVTAVTSQLILQKSTSQSGFVQNSTNQSDFVQKFN